MFKISVIKRFEYIAKKYPNNTAIITKEKKITYSVLNKDANKLAHYIKNNNILTKNKAIGIFIEPSIDMVISVLAIQKLGVPYVPIDVSYPYKRIKYMIKDSKISCILSLKKNIEKIESFDINILLLDKINYYNFKDTNLSSKNSDIMYILYTSGSTGVPKGVEVYQKGVTNYLNYSCDNYLNKISDNKNPASFIYLPLAFDASVTSLYPPLMMGRSIVIPSKKGLEIFDDILVQKNKFDFVKITPAHLLILKERMDFRHFKNWTKSLIIGGEALTLQHLAFLKKININWTIINEYGPTETVVGSSTFSFTLNSHVPDKIPIGKAIYNTIIYIIDKGGNLLPNGEVGEIVIGGDGVAKGYLNKKELTEEKFLENFILPGNRVYKTGDLGTYQEDGNLIYNGRIDEQVKIRGYRIEISEIEANLKKIPGILEAVVIIKENKLNMKSLEAFFTSEKDLDISIIKKKLSKSLPIYMLPSKFLRVEKIPITSNGKIDKKSLLKLDAPFNVSNKTLNKIEQQLLPIWKEILKTKNINIDDKFSTLGGHSLLAVMLISEVNKIFSVNIPILTLYPNGTLREIAKEIQIQKQRGV